MIRSMPFFDDLFGVLDNHATDLFESLADDMRKLTLDDHHRLAGGHAVNEVSREDPIGDPLHGRLDQVLNGCVSSELDPAEINEISRDRCAGPPPPLSEKGYVEATSASAPNPADAVGQPQEVPSGF
jgi:hypothetical protein